MLDARLQCTGAASAIRTQLRKEPTVKARRCGSKALTAFVLLLGVACSAGPEDVGPPSQAPDYSGAAHTDAKDQYLADVRAATSFPDGDSILLAVGEQVCYEVATQGEAYMRANFSGSSYSSAEQNTIISEAFQHLC